MFLARRSLRIMIAAALFFALRAAPLFAQGGPSPMPPERVPTPVLLELFTSEGCSSCPPADELLAKLNGTVAPSGQQIIALSEHVTYWNHLGWTDPFSLPFFTDRQSSYSDSFGTDEVYTPEVVVNGARDANGADRDAVLNAVKIEGLPLALDVQILSVHPGADRLTVVFTVEGKVPSSGAEIYAVLADDAETRHVARGENAGRTLTHVAVARAVGKSLVLRPGEQTIVSIPTVHAAPQPDSGRSLILIAQLPGQGRVIGLAREPLPSAPAGNLPRQLARTGTLEPH